ncbi:MAG: L,D-transpeptidase family protein [Flavobacteriales bacterium]|nr:L,D-transpeptidase family protein [Flavobacteriales bacterium]
MRTAPIVLALCLPLFVSCQTPNPEREVGSSVPPAAVVITDRASQVSLARLVDSLHLDATTMRFHVDKSERIFEVFVNDTLRKSYPCVLGEKPVGDKYYQGDRRTPEGTFTFRSKRVHDQWHKFIWVDYPNAESWKRYKARQAKGEIPAGKDIGGEIGIHGVPDGMDHWIDQAQDWTWGCIALRNADVDEIYPYIRPQRTLMEIVP